MFFGPICSDLMFPHQGLERGCLVVVMQRQVFFYLLWRGQYYHHYQYQQCYLHPLLR